MPEKETVRQGKGRKLGVTWKKENNVGGEIQVKRMSVPSSLSCMEVWPSSQSHTTGPSFS